MAGLLKEHNGRHARGNKGVSFRTRQLRGSGLFRIFFLLRTLGFKTCPSSLGMRHVLALMRYWTADPEYAAHCGTCGLTVKQCSPAYIQQQLSFLRVLCRWIGKPGMIGPAHTLVADPALVKRSYAASTSRALSDNGIDVEALLDDVGKRDPFVGVQLMVALAFGLRRKEAVMFCPACAEVPAEALPQDHANDRFLMFLRVERGTKGGRLRFVAVRTDFQKYALEKARLMAGPSHIGRPGLSLQQSLDLYSNTLRAAGLTKRKLGVTGHGARHEFASDLYVDLTGVTPPVNGGVLPQEIQEAAYLEVARQLGHGRPGISSAYLGSPTR